VSVHVSEAISSVTWNSIRERSNLVASYSAKVHGRPLDLTFKEFELLRFLATHPSRVFTREQLLSEVWGYDYFGGTRTVDVHVRRLREKIPLLVTSLETVKQFGYKLGDPPGAHP